MRSRFKLPAIRRTPMAFRPMTHAECCAEHARQRKIIQGNPDVPPWRGPAFVRRTLFLLVAIGSVMFAVRAVMTIFSTASMRHLEYAIILIFSVLFSWIAFNFTIALFGFLTVMRRADPLNPARVLAKKTAIKPATRVAVVMPVCNEEVSAVFAGLRAIAESVSKTRSAEHFSFFILSDSTDPAVCAGEERAWRAMVEEGVIPRVFYRRRKSHAGKKSGNIADFCRRWGSLFDYMIVLDSDSLMSGQAMENVVRIMDHRPDIGILQTAPKGINGRTLLARLSQFAGHAYGHVFLAGLHFWLLGDNFFWGHNAVVRLAPYMKFCALPKHKGRLPFGGEILSHDFIEGALMRRAGWGVWLAYDIDATYEQIPGCLNVELVRDRRWCSGNLQHLRFIALRGLSWGHKLLFLEGNMYYLSSLLWLILLVLSTAHSVTTAFAEVDFFPAGYGLFPVWPIQHGALAFKLLVMTVICLFLAKLLSVFVIVARLRCARQYGGVVRLLRSVIVETVFSIFLAPVRMLSHSIAFLLSLAGQKVKWNAAGQTDKRFSPAGACLRFGPGTLIAAGWAYYAYHFDALLFFWLAPVLIPLMLGIPVSLLVSSRRIGDIARKLGLLLTPEEIAPPPELVAYNKYHRA